MTTSNWQQLKELFQAALDLPPEERAVFLDSHCPDPSLRSEVESLLQSHQNAGEILETHALHLPSIAGNANEPVGEDASEQDLGLGQLVGPYKLIAKIGQGGMGSVYRAIRIDDHYLKQVAIKLLRPGLASEHYLRRFRNERQIMASLDHPNIARLLDGGTTGQGLPFFVLEYIEGEPIDRYCDDRRLSIVDRLKLFREVCSAVQYAHQHLVVHRDLKPQNILITNDGVPKLLDFGIAKLLDPELFLQTADLTATAVKPMTPEYASPEQVRGQPITTASDIYSLGVLLYRLLTGHPPYRVRGLPLSEMARIICETEPARPSLSIARTEETTAAGERTLVTPESVCAQRNAHFENVRRRLNGDVDNIVMKALNKEPERRYSSVEKLAEDISCHLDGLPVCARKDTIRYRTGKFIRRHKVGVSAATIVIVTLLGGIIATSHEARVARAERLLAEQRFSDVRKLANSMIFGLDDAIRDLPGATPAREILVNNAAQYLDKLARESKGDLSLQREVAAAYERVGDVQGNPIRPNIGDTAGALRSYHKAVAIREAIASSEPHNEEDQYALAESHRLLGFLSLSAGDLNGALESADRAVAIVEQLAKENAGDEKIVEELANAHKLSGDIEGGNGPSANLSDIASALAHHEKALAIMEDLVKAHPKDASLQSSLARVIIRTGDDFLKTGNRTEALKRYQSALDIFQGSQLIPDSMYSREVAVTLFRIGDAHAVEGDWNGALAAYRRSLERVAADAAADREDALARADLAETYAAVGRAMAHTGHVEPGLDYIRRGLALIEQEIARDPKHAELARVLAFITLWQGQVLSARGNTKEALASYRTSLNTFERLAADDQQDVDAKICVAAAHLEVARSLLQANSAEAAEQELHASLSLGEPVATLESPNEQIFYTVADARFTMGELRMKQAGGSNLQRAKKLDYWTEADHWYQRSAQGWHRVHNPGKLGPAGFVAGNPQLISARLEQCAAALNSWKHRELSARASAQSGNLPVQSR